MFLHPCLVAGESCMEESSQSSQNDCTRCNATLLTRCGAMPRTLLQESTQEFAQLRDWHPPSAPRVLTRTEPRLPSAPAGPAGTSASSCGAGRGPTRRGTGNRAERETRALCFPCTALLWQEARYVYSLRRGNEIIKWPVFSRDVASGTSCRTTK